MSRAVHRVDMMADLMEERTGHYELLPTRRLKLLLGVMLDYVVHVEFDRGPTALPRRPIAASRVPASEGHATLPSLAPALLGWQLRGGSQHDRPNTQQRLWRNQRKESPDNAADIERRYVLTVELDDLRHHVCDVGFYFSGFLRR